MKAKVSEILKEFGLTDDQILEIACEPRLTDAAELLRDAIWNKWNMTKLIAMQTVKNLKDEFATT